MQKTIFFHLFDDVLFIGFLEQVRILKKASAESKFSGKDCFQIRILSYIRMFECRRQN
jgi:hypothetical protein